MAIQAIQEKYVDEDALLRLDPDKTYEVIDGELVEMAPVGGLHHMIAGNIHDLIKLHVKVHKLGLVFMDSFIYLLSRDAEQLRGSQIPDVSYIRKQDIPADWEIRRPFPGAPTLAVEVVSPGDDPNLLLKRVRKYLEYGTHQVWVVFPDGKEVHQYRRGADVIRVYTGGDTMEIEDLFPGLTLTLTEIFAMPDLS
ncbi:MAG: Uma2 family endonuclease [Chloroflexi bacterium]|uniref:Uma2 family endonuclease n=1 Tax=Candidatus Flexifilum breve TaxID=3140694 RepID=UPI00313754FF|nr:Uma2 family endonuclease [Chloroflexota bacterium]